MEKSGNFYIEEAESDFKRIHKGIILNKDIDCLTLGIYVKILVLGKKWQLNIKGLSSYFDISDMKIRRSIALLEREGYISRKAVQDEKSGKLSGWNYTLHAMPLDKEKRTSAGRKINDCETEYPKNRVHGFPSTRFSEYTETGGDNNNKPNKDINLKEQETKNNFKNFSEENFLSEETAKAAGESQKKVNPARGQCEQAVEYFNAKVAATPGCKFPKVMKITETRKRAVAQRIREYGAETVGKVIDMAVANSFLNGAGGRSFVASFDWIMKPSNFVKVYEGNYERNNNNINSNSNGATEQDDYFRGRYNGTEATRQRAAAAARAIDRILTDSKNEPNPSEYF